MIGLPEIVAGTILAALAFYVLMAGADFGGGVWDLFATGPRAERQRHVIAHAIGPVWEANHVWMIVAVVLLFTGFPSAFAAIMTGLHIPITVMLVGIVLRGSSFVFRKVEAVDEGERSPWQLVFAISSLMTPVMIGVVIGTLSTPALEWRDGIIQGGFLRPWLQPFPWAIGGFTLALYAWLAATYLTLESDDEALQGDFRARALVSGAAVAVLGGISGALWYTSAVQSTQAFLTSGLGVTIFGAGALSWAGCMLALGSWRLILARAAAVVTALSIMAGWGLAQFPWLVPGSLTLRDAAAPDVTLRLVLWVLGGGSVLLVPAFVYLYVTFKRGVLFPRGESS